MTFPGLAPGRRPSKPPVRPYWYLLWGGLLVVGIVIFYGIFTPAWMALRLVAWLSERRGRRDGSDVA